MISFITEHGPYPIEVIHADQPFTKVGFRSLQIKMFPQCEKILYKAIDNTENKFRDYQIWNEVEKFPKASIMHYPDHHSEEEEKVAPVGGLAGEEEACQEEKTFFVLVTSDLMEEEETSTLDHKEVVTFYPEVEGAVYQKVAVTVCPSGEEGAHVSPWVLVGDQALPLVESSCRPGGRAFSCPLGWREGFSCHRDPGEGVVFYPNPDLEIQGNPHL